MSVEGRVNAETQLLDVLRRAAWDELAEKIRSGALHKPSHDTTCRFLFSPLNENANHLQMLYDMGILESFETFHGPQERNLLNDAIVAGDACCAEFLLQQGVDPDPSDHRLERAVSMHPDCFERVMESPHLSRATAMTIILNVTQALSDAQLLSMFSRGAQLRWLSVAKQHSVLNLKTLDKLLDVYGLGRRRGYDASVNAFFQDFARMHRRGAFMFDACMYPYHFVCPDAQLIQRVFRKLLLHGCKFDEDTFRRIVQCQQSMGVMNHPMRMAFTTFISDVTFSGHLQAVCTRWAPIMIRKFGMIFPEFEKHCNMAAVLRHTPFSDAHPLSQAVLWGNETLALALLDTGAISQPSIQHSAMNFWSNVGTRWMVRLADALLQRYDCPAPKVRCIARALSISAEPLRRIARGERVAIPAERMCARMNTSRRESCSYNLFAAFTGPQSAASRHIDRHVRLTFPTTAAFNAICEGREGEHRSEARWFVRRWRRMRRRFEPADGREDSRFWCAMACMSGWRASKLSCLSPGDAASAGVISKAVALRDPPARVPEAVWRGVLGCTFGIRGGNK